MAHRQRQRLRLGTSSVVVAAFVGPGTVLTCTTAGVRFGNDLGWVLLFSIGATFVLQSFTAGSGILAGKGLGESIRDATHRSSLRLLVLAAVVLGLWVGTAAFQTGNVLGAAAGFESIAGNAVPKIVPVVAITLVAGLVLALGLKWVTRILAVLVGLMSMVFILAMLMAPVSWGTVVTGLVRPSIPGSSIVTVLALVGTTVVGYNLFLHASAAKACWVGVDKRLAWRQELTGMAVFLPAGGVISLAIMTVGATLSESTADFSSVGDLAAVLEPATGAAASVLFGLGLFAAGITSAVTAPMAAALGISEIFRWNKDANPWRLRLVWLSVLMAGLAFSALQYNPLQIIIAAQAANGFLLPALAGFVVFLAASQREVAMPRWYVACGVLVVVICAGLGARTLSWVWSQIGL